MIYAFVKKGSFQDSVSLMIISRKLSERPEVDQVSVMMGTPANKAMLDSTGFWHDDFADATPNDICVAVRTHEEQPEILELIREQLEKELSTIANASGSSQRLLKARRWESACQKLPQANLLLISVAGEYAASVAKEGLLAGKNVMIFSDNVPLEQEVELKTLARERELIVMGPDCGTAMIAGSPLAFANVLPDGGIGVIGASGTGIQEVTSQIALHQQGISHAIGLGGRDLSADVGGMSALTALEMLAADDATRVIAFVSKPPSPQVRTRIIEAMQKVGKPVVALFLGSKPEQRREGNVWLAHSLSDAAQLAVLLMRVAQQREIQPEVAGKGIYGLYAGGTLAAEAAMLLSAGLGIPVSESHVDGVMLETGGHRIVDLGDDSYTLGRPHPMIDPTTRSIEIEKLAAMPDIGVLLLDVVLGYGACANPAGAVVDAIELVRAKRAAPLVTIATLTGTDADPQGRNGQIDILRAAGIAVVETLEEAVLLAISLTHHQDVSATVEHCALLDGIQVINAGLRSFALDLQSSGTPVVHYQWAPIAGGNARLASLLKQLH
ncbi:acyl-CoA synthetase FdrA [Salmonella enterica]|uniref:Membrane transport protein n=2 Tax=Salmonella enterica TaxID=28901 RepID=A0A379QFG5_SALER|nr:acyl-CoA synthetase FdrA [Salmonella enterica]ECC1482541.1 acyl-CoA synthetase FdrA [Salmonella enterica subsp. salamae]EHM1751091.1 acyl-CoA synthetase FdrA [Salmonella enterica subsp. salamae serovar 40:c:e,n,x,z15]HCM2000895.1 acyl-CoA synthetase FdrA [Salmonella enterica subsp. salamae serovar [1],40:z35:e,n,x,z15]ASG86919.1 acyl-CoA synthetase FdrA [Salmonella enterica subsp. salamae serovar 55:k:z39 str. 1315K]ECC1655588.1 acyl-CoA synthetase FdrA [Salmonella enterica subsp. salamae]